MKPAFLLAFLVPVSALLSLVPAYAFADEAPFTCSMTYAYLGDRAEKKIEGIVLPVTTYDIDKHERSGPRTVVKVPDWKTEVTIEVAAEYKGGKFVHYDSMGLTRGYQVNFLTPTSLDQFEMPMFMGAFEGKQRYFHFFCARPASSEKN